ncbi:MAG: sigma-54 dependent transcriptional regulator [Oligoflexia bacterium]|nr:sigma-54 dependent transcriptional regulator [Oligoflexia bacterium]
MKAILIDDDSEALLSLARALKVSIPVLSCEVATCAERAKVIVREQRPEVAVLDLCIDTHCGVQSGFELLEQLLLIDPTLRVLVLTGHGSPEHGVRALNLGAASFLEKPADIGHLAALIRDGERQSTLRRSFVTLQKQAEDGVESKLIGGSQVMQRLREEVQLAARTPQPILLLGETGTGKGVCARLIHELSVRADKRFVRYQPNFASADLVNSEIFGHVKGAFTGAMQDRIGLIGEADGGSLFLDEVEELPLETQVGLLGVLQERQFRPVGANRELAANFRLICASNRDTLIMIEQGKLRRDFYHRIAHQVIRIPSLSEHVDDIPMLAQHFLHELGKRDCLNVFGLSQEALATLEQHPWPGNVRELQAVIEGAAYRASANGRTQVEKQDLSFLAQMASNSEFAAGLNEQVDLFRRRLISAALSKHNGNQVQAARDLRIDRSTLRRILSRSGGAMEIV